MTKRVDPLELIRKYYDPESEAYRILTIHSERVTAKALDIVDRKSASAATTSCIPWAGTLSACPPKTTP